jgi:hypothetical protein
MFVREGDGKYRENTGKIQKFGHSKTCQGN